MTMQAFLVVLLATGALAAPFQVRSHKKCSKRTLRFPSGKELTYNYVGETVSSVNGSSTAHSALKIRARCVIKTVGSCQHVLKIDSVGLWQGQSENFPIEYRFSWETALFARELQAHDLVFRSRNGAIVEVLSSYDETPQALNIKKGILSALQVQFVKDNSLVNETDISGKCPVHYRIYSKHLNGVVKVLSKTRNLKECSDRSKTNLGIHVHQYNEKSLNLLSSSSNCRYMLHSKKRVQKVVCREKHMFRPFSSGAPAGATTTTKQILELQSTTKAPMEYGYNVKALPRSSPLTFEHVKPNPSIKDSNQVIEIIKQLARHSIEETKPESARMFSHLIFHLRKLNSKAVEKVWDGIFQCELCTPQEKDKFQLYLLDALPHCGTSGCAMVMSRAIERKLVNGERGNMFLTGLALVSVPTEDMISHVLRLCQVQSSRTCMLTLGTLIHKYCENGKCKEDVRPIVEAESWLLGLLGKRCDFQNPEQAEQIIMALKAIGNAGRPSSEQARLILSKCAKNQQLPTNMTLAAIKALRRMPCSQDTTEQLFGIYDNLDVDVEIRIEAYLALLKCPSIEVFARIAKIQKKEVNKQVGSFVWSHITNAMESTEPLHGRPLADMIRKALGGKIIREFNLNRLRFSRAWEASYYDDMLRAGGSLQGHVIYHPNSYFPRSTHVNLTVDVLGASINVLEAAARFEGFENLIEQFFGRDSNYLAHRIMDMFNKLKPHEQRGEEKKPVRRKRSVDDIRMSKVETHLNELHAKMDKLKHAPSGAISVNLFGNELRLASFDDINWLHSEADNINMVDFLIKLARGGNKTFTKSMMFLDAETTIPTILGLPLKLDAKGTTVVSVLMNGKFDIRNMFWGPMAFDVRGHLKPSAVVEVTGRMGVDAVFAEAGILLNTSLYTSTEIRGNATYKQGQVLKFEVGAPSKPMQIFNVSSSLFATLNEEEIQIRGTQRRFEPAPCVNFTRVLGLAVCSRMSLPVALRDIQAPFFPLSGPASFSLSVILTDPKLRLYQIVVQRLPTEDENNFDIIARISTPSATWEREFEANASLWLKDQKKSFSISTGALGYKFGNLSGSYHNYTNAINLTFETRDVIYGNRIALYAQYFNKTNPDTKERRIGTAWSAMYKNYTITQLTEIYNKSRTYGFVSNMTYWPGKYFYANGEVDIFNKSLRFLGNHTCTKSSVRFDGQLTKDYNNFLFNVSTGYKNMSVEVGGVMNKVREEAIAKTYILPCKQSFTLRSSYVARETEKGIHFKASHDNKNRVFAWYTGFLNQTHEKSIKANASILGNTFETVLTFFDYTNEKGIKFDASALNKTIEAFGSYSTVGAERDLKFTASFLNKTIQPALTFLNLPQEKNIKLNATVLNKTMEVVAAFFNLSTEKALQFRARGFNKSASTFLSYSYLPSAKALMINATVLNKTAEAALTYLNTQQEKVLLNFSANILNKKAEAVWMFFNQSSEKGLRFSAQAMNKKVEGVWTYFHTPFEKGLKFNTTILRKTANATLAYFKLVDSIGVRFNASALNRSIGLVSKIVKQGDDKKVVRSGIYQNYSMGLVAALKNLTTFKSGCVGQNITKMLIKILKNHPLPKSHLNYVLSITIDYIRDLNFKYRTLARKNINFPLHFWNATYNYFNELNFTKIANLTNSYASNASNWIVVMFNPSRLWNKKTADRIIVQLVKRWVEKVRRLHFMSVYVHSWVIRFTVGEVVDHEMRSLRSETCDFKPECTLEFITNSAMRMTKETIRLVYGLIINSFLRPRQTCLEIKTAFNSTVNLNTNIYITLMKVTIKVVKEEIKKLNVSSDVMVSFVNRNIKLASEVIKSVISVLENTIAQEYLNTTNYFFNITRHFVGKLNMTKIAKMVKTYATKAFNMTRDMCKVGISEAHKFTMEVVNIAWNISADVYDSTRVRHLHHLKKYWHRRLAHKLHHLKIKLSPSQWIPPFNSTAMIFGKPHVYTFDDKYFRFPGYKNQRCTYVLARDVRDNKFTLLSQETALLLITDDANVKIHDDGRVESMTKINTEGVKIHDGYNSELPVQSANMTVAREGPYIILRHTLGIEILCDVDHYLCTFNIARWYHGRLAGLLGTNNNENHDEMLTPDNKIAKNVLDFINSWEITKDEKCKIYKERKPKSQCTTKYSSRCKEIFAKFKSPFAPFFKTVDPQPFKTACENDYNECDTNTPKDMKHCNTTAAYIELLKMKGQWIDYLPECGRCDNHEMGSKWFQSASKAIDMILIVPETQGMQSFARQIPRHISELQRNMEGYSLRFGLVSFGGKGIHLQPHAVTINGKYLGSAEEIKSSIEHLRFSDTTDNETDGFEAIAKAAHYPFRGASTKILVLFTTSERFANPNAPCIRRMTKKLQMRDITLNIIGKYQKLRGEKMGQDYLGRMIYRKLEGPSIRGVPLPRGEYVQLMQNTKGSMFGISFFASDDREQVYRPFNASYLKVLREQVKRDQNMCKECFCARGLVGEGRTICKINEHHKC